MIPLARHFMFAEFSAILLKPSCEAEPETLWHFYFYLEQDRAINTAQMLPFLVNTFHKHLCEQCAAESARGQFHRGLTIKPATNPICHLVARGTTHWQTSFQCRHCVGGPASL